ncbi:hypothetical protein [Actinoplanes palleronii]|uniref:Uncharacterized protein n=1 Tax=Actinoplanes palleronii TaxID=113570 RepID=A0ABQ4B7L7_9ACTN|nr:hypothetical protein [Actinoplanes palleronii]GIE66633.1 hypothetical protein Apa02nite_027410 [Actinoplanes palleronii]
MTRLLLPHLARAVPWSPFAAAVLLAAVAQLPTLLRDDPAPTSVLFGLRIAAAALGAAAGFALPDLMASTVITPAPRWRRQWLRIALPLLPAVVLWAGLYLVVRGLVRPEMVWPDGFVVLQATVCGLLPVAFAALGARYRDTAVAALTGPVTQGVVLVGSLFLSDRSSPWTVPAAAGWTVAQRAWPVAFVLLLAVLLTANREVVRTSSR